MAPTKWQLKREASYEALVSSAMRRFHEHGFAATRVEDIVDGTGYSKGAFYFHFANKLECFWHAIEYRQRTRTDWSSLPERYDPDSTSLEEIVRLALRRLSESTGELDAWVLAMVDCYQQIQGDEEARTRLASVYTRWQDELVNFVRCLQVGGWIPTGKAPALLARQIFAYGEGLTVHARLYGLSATSVEEALYDGIVALLSAPRKTAT